MNCDFSCFVASWLASWLSVTKAWIDETVQSLIHDRDGRISELEEALRESIRITAQREVVMAEQQMKLEHTERMVKHRYQIADQLQPVWLCSSIKYML